MHCLINRKFQYRELKAKSCLVCAKIILKKIKQEFYEVETDLERSRTEK